MIENASDNELLPARMVNEYVYCPRLFWLEYVEREFAHSYDTVDGERVHRRVDTARGTLPEDVNRPVTATSVELASEQLGLVAKIDLVEIESGNAIPIDYKRGAVPHNGPYEPERVQISVQALLLREAGYMCNVGRIYYAASKTSVDIPVDDNLIALANHAIAGARDILRRNTIPPPLIDSPKCGRCSLHGICLPDEITTIRSGAVAKTVRPFAAPADDRVPIYVMQAGARVGISGETLNVRVDDEKLVEIPLIEVASVSLFGNAHISSQAMRALLARDTPIFYLTYGGWLNGYARSLNDHSLDLRLEQFAAAKDVTITLPLARAFVAGKVKNQRTMIRRALGDRAARELKAMALLLRRIEHAAGIEELLGHEGMAARHYFEAFGEMLTVGTGFEVTGRNRRPPTDPINAMLSFGYSMLAKEAVAALVTVGFEPGLGFLHQRRAGRPSLALDLMEEFRPLVVDSTVLSLVNTKEIRASHFDRRGRATVLTQDGRRTFIGAIERRLRSSIAHPTFGYQVTYRRALNVQARLLARAVQRDIPLYPAFTTR